MANPKSANNYRLSDFTLDCAVVNQGDRSLIQAWIKESLTIEEILTLKEIGIILDEGLGLQYQWNVESKKDYYTTLTDEWVLGLQNTGNDTIKFYPNVYKLSTAGREILKLVNVSENEKQAFYKLIADACKEKGISHVSLHKIVNMNGNQTSFEDQGIEI